MEDMAIRRRTRAANPRPWLKAADVGLAGGIPLLWLLALALPERRWPRLCYRLEWLRASLHRAELTQVARAAAGFPGVSPGADARSLALSVAAGATEHHLQVLACRGPRGWKTRLRLDGAEHLDAALAAGRGAVLWVAHFCFNALAAKKALHQAGYRVWHLSRPEHGFSKSALGIRLYNRLRVGAEREFLAGRIVFDRSRPGAATLAAQRLLRKNGILSITAGDWEGQRLARIELGGGTIELAVGAPGLARLTGAALLPVFAVRDEHRVIRVTIEPPLPVAREGDADQALQRAAQVFGALLAQYVCRYPEQWRDWKKLEPSPTRGRDGTIDGV